MNDCHVVDSGSGRLSRLGWGLCRVFNGDMVWSPYDTDTSPESVRGKLVTEIGSDWSERKKNAEQF